jgi:acyl carrier protein
MSSLNIFNDISQIMSSLMQCDIEEIQFETTAADIDKWDSMSNIRLLLELEKHFGIRFTGMEAASLENVGELVQLIEHKII